MMDPARRLTVLAAVRAALDDPECDRGWGDLLSGVLRHGQAGRVTIEEARDTIAGLLRQPEVRAAMVRAAR